MGKGYYKSYYKCICEPDAAKALYDRSHEMHDEVEIAMRILLGRLHDMGFATFEDLREYSTMETLEDHVKCIEFLKKRCHFTILDI